MISHLLDHMFACIELRCTALWMLFHCQRFNDFLKGVISISIIRWLARLCLMAFSYIVTADFTVNIIFQRCSLCIEKQKLRLHFPQHVLFWEEKTMFSL